MARATFEESEELGQPVELYLFTYGESGQFAYCSGDTPVVFETVTYNPLPITRGTVNANGGTDKSTMSIDVPLSSEIVQLFAVYPPSSKVVLRIRQGHYDDPDVEFPIIWAGQVYTCSRAASDSSKARLTCRPASVSLSRTGLRTHYQIACPKTLYGPRCRANKAAATISTTVSAVTYTTVTLPAAWFGALDPLKFQNGTVEWVTPTGRAYRTILSVGGTGNVTITLNGPTSDLVAAQAIDVVLGCDRQPFSDCVTLHNNIQNYGGIFASPKDNPLGGDNPYTTA